MSEATVSPLFLSVDIDFWAGRINEALLAERYLDKVAAQCRTFNIPLNAVTNHQQMLPLVDASNATTLVNIDTHSDLAGDDVDELNTGTWVSYVKWRRNGHYHWIQGRDIAWGECNGSSPIFSPNGKHNYSLTDWGSLQRTYTLSLPHPGRWIVGTTTRCVGVGVCLSPAWCSEDLSKVFHAWRKRWKVSYRRGRIEEERMGTKRVPR